ncbi:DUF4132 domain-containing protein [Streptomyces sp. NPDC001787]|uniref:DUF4132 domain-containing protein n=1 Tax=Streptomyces sp. NPDC001787 TaxID=3154523 RepID=UPI00332E9481
MRRWEYVEGTASKFWETGSDGLTVTVRYGRCGSDGRTQTKEYASAEAARAQILKTIAEKERKGYREVGAADAGSASGPAASVSTGSSGSRAASRSSGAAGASGSAGSAHSTGSSEAAVSGDVPETGDGSGDTSADTLPDEDTFGLPANWRRVLHPRRGGVPRAPGKARRQVLEAVEARVAEDAAWIEEFLTAPRTDSALAAKVRSHLAGDPSPVGAAALAAMVTIPAPHSAWADTWAGRHGLPFAACAAVELLEINARWNRNGSRRTRPVLQMLGSARHAYWSSERRPALDRVRALIAAADEETYRATVTALADCRTTAQRRIIAAYLAPSECDWVAELCTDAEVTGERDQTFLAMVFSSLDSAEQVEVFSEKPGFGHSVALIATVAEGIGTAVAPLLAEALTGYCSADGEKLVTQALTEIPTDEAFLPLLRNSDKKHSRAALLDAMRRYPVRALRLLGADVRDSAGAASKTSGKLLLGHIGAHRELVASLLPALSPELAEIVEPLLNPVDRIADAPAHALPDVLTSPPWSRPRRQVKTLVVPGLEAVGEPSARWERDEREAWAACSSWYTRKEDIRDWDKEITHLRHSLDSDGLHPAWVYVHGPEDLVAPHLATWDPTDLWDGEDTLKPIAARFGLAALPLLLRAVPRQPGQLAPLLLPFVDVRVARHMADWAVRLKSTAATARTWFARHGAGAAGLLVPDAVGKAGAARRSAEHALLQIASVHGDGVVREAAAAYGERAAEAVEELLAADPLERVLPARMPEVPGWAEPVLLPQIRVRSGGALPERSVRDAVMMLALSRPGDVYAGVAALRETAEPDSLAEFAWALFQQWQQANLPASESWALHALGLLGDDGTVRRLTPVIRAWPGEGAHHRAVEGLDVLASIGSDVALLHLNAISQRVKFKGLKLRAQEKIAEVASGLGLTGEQLADRLVPDFGLDADGSTVIDYGSRTFTVGFDEQLRPYVLDADGKRRKDLPAPGARDDAEAAPAERKRFMALKKDVRTIAADQVRRLEAAMVAGRTWTAQEFRELFVGHPLLWHLVRRLVWLSDHDGARVSFRVAEDRTFADAGDDGFALPDGATVGLAHPLHLGDELTVWSEVFTDYEILQPFPQLGRAVYALTEEEAGGYRLPRFEGLTVPIGKVLGLERRGWQRGVPQDAGVERWISKRLGDECYLVIALYEGIAVGVVDMFPDQKLETVWLDTEPSDHWNRRTYNLRFGALDPVVVSELLGDLAELTEGVVA